MVSPSDERPKPFAFVSAVLAVAFVIVSVYLGVTRPRPSSVPTVEPSAYGVACEDLDSWIERTRAQGYTSLIRSHAGLGFHRDSRAVFLTCGERRWVLSRAGGIDDGPEGILLRITTDGRLVTPLPGHTLSPRADAEAAHFLGLALGVLGVLMGVATWAFRPFDPVVDLVGRRAPASAVILAEPSNDRVAWRRGEREGEVGHRHVVDDGAELVPGDPKSPHIGLPGAEGTYRDAAGGGPYVSGGQVNGLPVAAGAHTALLDGDVVDLGHGAFVVSLREPGRVLRYLAADGRVRLSARFRDARAFRWLAPSLTLGVASAVALHTDTAFVWLAAPLAALAFAAAYRVPARLSRRVTTELPLQAVLDGTAQLTLVDEGQLGCAVVSGGRTIGRLPIRGERASAERARLLAELERELSLLGLTGEGEA